MLLGSCSLLNNRSEKEEMLQIAKGKKAQRAIEELLRQEDSKALTEEGIIKEYSINKDELEYNPMGGLIIELIINDDPELTIKTTLMEESDGKLEHTGYVISGELAKKLRGE
jgi:hypothetical protein